MSRRMKLPPNTYVGRFITEEQKDNDDAYGAIVATTREAIYSTSDIKYEDKYFIEFWLPDNCEFKFIRLMKRNLIIE